MTATVLISRTTPKTVDAVAVPVATTGSVPRSLGLNRAALTAAGFEGKHDADTIAARVERISSLADELMNQRAEDRIGDEVLVHVESVDPRTLDDVFAGLEHGYQSVRPALKDAERIEQWETSRKKMQEAYTLYKSGDNHQGTRTLQEAEELFIALRRIKGKKVSRQELGDTEHGANELDE